MLPYKTMIQLRKVEPSITAAKINTRYLWSTLYKDLDQFNWISVPPLPRSLFTLSKV